MVAEAEDRLLAAIVALEMRIDRLEGKFKLSQNRSPEDQAGAIEGLEKQADADSQTLAEFRPVSEDLSGQRNSSAPKAIATMPRSNRRFRRRRR